ARPPAVRVRAALRDRPRLDPRRRPPATAPADLPGAAAKAAPRAGPDLSPRSSLQPRLAGGARSPAAAAPGSQRWPCATYSTLSLVLDPTRRVYSGNRKPHVSGPHPARSAPARVG